MAFPTTPILDDFNSGSTQNLTARTGWGTSPFPTSSASFLTDGTPTTAIAPGGGSVGGNNWGSVTWNDMEAYCTLLSFSAVTDTFMVCARITGFGASPTHYAVALARSSSTDFQIVKVVAGTVTAVGTLQAQAITSGDSVGIDVIGTQIRSYYKSGAGSWTLKDTATDSSITASGAIGFRHLFAAGNVIDSFGGGSLDVAPVTPTSPRQFVSWTTHAGGA